MAIVLYSELIPEVLINALSCPDFIAERALRHVALDFFRRTHVYRETLSLDPDGTESISLTAGLPTETRAEEILWVRYNQQRNLVAISEKMLNAKNVNWEDDTGDPYYYFQPSPNTISLAPHPAGAEVGTVTARVVLVPTRTSTGVEQIYMDEHYEALVDGAVAKILSINAEEWANPNLSQLYTQRYENAVLTATNRAERNGTPVVREVRYGGLTD